MEYTILVNSCDSYEDLWEPFFSLLKRYWNGKIPPIVLNTETKNFAMEGLDIRCPHCPNNPKGYYGKRMRYALSSIETENVLCLLDDFFIREPVNVAAIDEAAGYLEKNKEISCFNFENCYEGQPSACYKGYILRPVVSEYQLNMQAALWRKADYASYWKDKVDPWSWETVTNKKTYSTDKIFYFLSPEVQPPINYGKRPGLTWGVVRGKWLEEDVLPLFKKEDIHVDYAVRGFYTCECAAPRKKQNWTVYYKKELYILGAGYVLKEIWFSTIIRRLNLMLGRNVGDYEVYLACKRGFQKEGNNP